MTRVVIVEDQRRFRETLGMVVDAEPDLELAASLPDIDALEEVLEADPRAVEGWDVVLMDLELPGRDGVAGLHLIKARRPSVRVVMCTVQEGSAAVRRALRAGADGYLVKRATLDEILHQLRKAAAGGAPVSPEVAGDLLQLVRDTASLPSTPRWSIRLDGSSITAPTGERTDLRRRRNVRHLLSALARHRLEQPGHALSHEACLEAGWPGETMRPDAAAARLHTAVRTLRSLGLEDALETVGSGYRLAEGVQVRR